MKYLAVFLMVFGLTYGSYKIGYLQGKGIIFAKPMAYKVGECFSNGLYIEQINKIEHGRYVLIGLMIRDDGTKHFTLPNKTDEYILDSNYTKITCPSIMDK